MSTATQPPAAIAAISVRTAEIAVFTAVTTARTVSFAALMEVLAACCVRFAACAAAFLLGLDSDTFYIYHVAAVMVDNLRRLLLGINLSDKAIMDFDFPGVGFPV